MRRVPIRIGVAPAIAARPRTRAAAILFCALLPVLMWMGCGSPKANPPAPHATAPAATTAQRDTRANTGVAPSIVSPPQDLVIAEGSASFFRVYAKGTPPVTYRWSKNGQPGAVSSQPDLWFVNPTARDSGTYTVQVTNAWGKAVAQCRLTVEPRGK